MRRSTRLLVAIVAAILTYASLMVFAGPSYRSRHGFYSHHERGHSGRYHCGEHSSWHKDQSGANSRQETPPANTPQSNP